MKKLIKDLHEIGNIEVNQRIEIDYPELGKPVLEVGKWYKHIWSQNTFIFKKDEDNGYGFFEKEWGDDWSFQVLEYWDLATDTEVKEALINEAVKRYNIKENEVFRWEFEGGNFICHNPMHDAFDYNYNTLDLDCGILFLNGVWGTKTKTPLTIEQRLQRIETKLGL